MPMSPEEWMAAGKPKVMSPEEWMAAGKPSAAATPAPEPTKTGMKVGGMRELGLGTRDVLTGAGSLLNQVPEAVGGFAKGAASLAGYPAIGEDARKALQPPNLGGMASDFMGLPKPQTGGEQRQSGIQRAATEIAVPLGNAATVNAARAVPGMVKSAGKWMADVPGRVGGAIERGYGMPQAQQGALSAGRELVSGEAGRVGREAEGALSAGQKASASALSEAHSYEDLATRLERDLAASAKNGVPSASKQGETARGVVEGAYKAGKAARTAGTKPLYDAADAQATALEKAGGTIDVSDALKGMQKVLAESQSNPTLNNALTRMYSAIKDAKGHGVTTDYAALKTQVEYLKDIGYSGELQGYDRIARRAALDLAKEVDAAIAKSIPAHAQASAKYAELSEPLATMSTRIGRAVTGSEGALTGDAFSKIANEDLPARLFGKRDGVEQVVHALAGGENATPAQLAKAQKQVDQMVEHYLMSTARGGAEAPRIGTGAMNAMGKHSGTLEAVPEVGARMRGQFEREAGKMKTIEELAKGSAEARSRATTATEGAAKTAKPLQAEQTRLNDLVRTADELSKAGNQAEALSKYTNAIRAGLANDQPKYQAALAWINRAESATIKAERAKKLARWMAHGAAYGVGAGAVYEVGKQL